MEISSVAMTLLRRPTAYRSPILLEGYPNG